MLEAFFGSGQPLIFVKTELYLGGESIVIITMKTTATNTGLVPFLHEYPDEACFSIDGILDISPVMLKNACAAE